MVAEDQSTVVNNADFLSSYTATAQPVPKRNEEKALDAQAVT
jgi:hypothetical protein